MESKINQVIIDAVHDVCEECIVRKNCNQRCYDVVKMVSLSADIERIARQEEREKYISIIRKLVDTLQTSKNYHLGITGLDSPQEIEEKQRKHETALIRSINRALEYGRKAMEGGNSGNN